MQIVDKREICVNMDERPVKKEERKHAFYSSQLFRHAHASASQGG